jgi:hypothetical protein
MREKCNIRQIIIIYAEKMKWQRKKPKNMYSWAFRGTPEWIRTTDPQLRRLLLYPAELPALIGKLPITSVTNSRENKIIIFLIIIKTFFANLHEKFA